MKTRSFTVAIFALVLVMGCIDTQDQHGPNIILISMDTTRADHLGCYGHDGVKTPNIDALARQSMVFERCFSAIPITLPSHTTMLSGRYPIRHSVRDNGTFTVPKDLPTLASILGKHGWQTIGVIGAYPLTARFGLALGFEMWNEDLTNFQDDVMALAFDQRPANEVTDAALGLIDGEVDGPVFLFVHYFDPHRPWTAPALYGRRYRNSPYDAEIAFTDTSIGRLLDGLRNRGLLDNAIVILTADHGEGFRDHEEETHSYLLFNETTRVPLLLSGPGIEPGVVEHPVSLVDIAPTVLEMVGIDSPPDTDGRSLLRDGDPQRLIYIESLAGRLHHGWNDVRAAVMGPHKYILGHGTQLFNLEIDMRERSDLVAEKPELADRMDRELRDFIAKNQGQVPLKDAFTKADDDVVRQLEALGYVVPAEQVPDRDWSELGPITIEGDPRLNIELVEIQSLTRAAINQGEIPFAMETIETGLDRHPEDIELLRLLVMARLRIGDSAGAADASVRLQRVSNREPRDDVLFAMAALANRNHDDAMLFAERAAEVTGDVRERRLLARVLFTCDRPDEGLSILVAILDEDPCNTEALRDLAGAQRKMGDRTAVESTYRSILECAPGDPSPLVNLGNLALEAGDLDTARDLYLKAVERNPGYAIAHYSLGVAAMEAGNPVDARRSLREALLLAPLNSRVGRQAAELLRRMEDTP